MRIMLDEDEGYVHKSMTIFEDEDVRVSPVLGPDGENLIIERKKMRIGFAINGNYSEKPPK